MQIQERAIMTPRNDEPAIAPTQVPRVLTVAVIVMGILLVFGTIGLVVAIVMRGHGAHHAAPAVPPVPDAQMGDLGQFLIDEPPQSHIAAVSEVDGLLALTLTGGGPDRVLLVDAAHHRVVERIALMR